MTTNPLENLDSGAALSAPVMEERRTLIRPLGVRRFYQWAARLLNELRADPSLRAACFAFLLTRSLVFLLFIISAHVTFKEPLSDFGEKPHEPRIAISGYSVPQKLRELATRADGAWYLSIAEKGYEKKPLDLAKPHNWAFFPLYPLAVRAVAVFTGDYRLAAIALSNLFFFGALTLLHKTLLAFDYDVALADRAIFYVAASPASYFFSLPWTSSLSLMLTAGAFLAARRGVWSLAGVCAGLASATHYTGSFLSPALLIFYWQCNRPFKLRANILWLLLAPAGLLVFMGYLHSITGSAFAFASAQAAWKVQWGFFMRPLAGFIINPFELSAGWNFKLLNFAAAATALICGFAWIKRREWAWAFYTFISTLMPLSTLTLGSQARYMAVVFPLFVMLASWGRSPLIDQTIRAVFLVMLALTTAFFGFFFGPGLV
jgi:hypothetical protein